jgi:hypothetical protein
MVGVESFVVDVNILAGEHGLKDYFGSLHLRPDDATRANYPDSDSNTKSSTTESANQAMPPIPLD